MPLLFRKRASNSLSFVAKFAVIVTGALGLTSPGALGAIVFTDDFATGGAGWTLSQYARVQSGELVLGEGSYWYQGISQWGTSPLISVVAGDTYTLSFEVGGRPYKNPNVSFDRTIRPLLGTYASAALINGGTSYSSGTPDGSLVSVSESFIAPSSSIFLTFLDVTPDFGASFGAGLVADITLTGVAPAVPEPAVWTMMLIGFGLLGSCAQARRNTRRCYGIAVTGNCGDSAFI